MSIPFKLFTLKGNSVIQTSKRPNNHPPVKPGIFDYWTHIDSNYDAAQLCLYVIQTKLTV